MCILRAPRLHSMAHTKIKRVLASVCSLSGMLANLIIRKQCGDDGNDNRLLAICALKSLEPTIRCDDVRQASVIRRDNVRAGWVKNAFSFRRFQVYGMSLIYYISTHTNKCQRVFACTRENE